MEKARILAIRLPKLFKHAFKPILLLPKSQNDKKHIAIHTKQEYCPPSSPNGLNTRFNQSCSSQRAKTRRNTSEYIPSKNIGHELPKWFDPMEKATILAIRLPKWFKHTFKTILLLPRS